MGPPPPSSPPCPRIRKALDVLKFTDQLERTPGFGNSIGFSFRHLSPEQFRFDDHALKIRLPLTESFLWKDYASSQRQQSVGMLSTFAALVDEATTIALIVNDDGRPGVTVLLSMEAGPALHDLRVGEDIEITSIVQKKGQNMAFTKAEIRLVSTGRLVCWGSHIKFLNNLPRVGNLLLSSRGWPFLKAYGNISTVLKRFPRIKCISQCQLLGCRFHQQRMDGCTTCRQQGPIKLVFGHSKFPVHINFYRLI
eukprot:scaffold3257_cov152-Amphora_coffeaeformis.AAC.5